MAKSKELNFESALKRLEALVAQLESRETPLDESLALFEEGVQLTRFCKKRLDDAKKKVEVLNKATGELRDFQGDSES